MWTEHDIIAEKHSPKRYPPPPKKNVIVIGRGSGRRETDEKKVLRKNYQKDSHKRQLHNKDTLSTKGIVTFLKSSMNVHTV